jgi:hypothetical protein
MDKNYSGYSTLVAEFTLMSSLPFEEQVRYKG